MSTHDVQALVYASFAQLRHCRYLLLRIEDPAAARRWLRQASVMGLVMGGGQLGRQNAQDEALAVAFTHAGLLRMGLQDDAEFPFPSAFREGMNQPDRAKALADANVEAWQWGDLPGAQRQAVHLLLAHFRRTPFEETGPLSAPALQEGGLALVQPVPTCPAFIDVSEGSARLFEPFGFRDGLTQPVLRSGAAGSRRQQQRREREGDMADDSVVADGEFVLGLPNEYGDPSYAPDDARWRRAGAEGDVPPHFGSHGSYLVVRQIRQHVDRFEAFDAAHPPLHDKAPSLTERMVGRRKDGSALVQLPFAPAHEDAFRFRVNDAEGFQCPLGSHIRRANPRDSLGADLLAGVAGAKLHRLIRRGRVYAGDCQQSEQSGCGHADGRRGCGRGLFFIALNADLDRQFEFVQQRWITHPQFAGLANESDPLLGGHGESAFTVQSPTVSTRTAALPAFTELVGGGYFFLPGLTALRFLAETEPAPGPSSR
jgi:porphyrinogen peroxidase